MKILADILSVAVVPVAVALFFSVQQALLLSRSTAPEAKRQALACDVYRVSWTSGALGLVMFGFAGLFFMVQVSFTNPDRLVSLAFCGLAILFAGFGVHSILSVFRTSAHFRDDRFKLRTGSRVQTLQYDELTSLAIASGHIVCERADDKPFRIPTIFKGNALILARLRIILEKKVEPNPA